MTINFKTYDLAVELYRKVEHIHAKPSLRDQLLRASESVVLNLADHISACLYKLVYRRQYK